MIYRSSIVIIICVLLVSGCAVAPVADRPTLSINSEWFSLNPQERIEIRKTEIFSFTKSYAAGRGYLLGPGAEMELINYADYAAREIEALPLSEQSDKIEEAKINFKIIVDRMIIESFQIPGYKQTHPGIIGESSLSNALGALCPLWPFCK